MATEVKVGGRNDAYALKQARLHRKEAFYGAESALREVGHMREAVGRPDFNRITSLLGELIANLSKTGTCLEEMMVIRAEAGQGGDAQVDDRIAFLEKRVESLTKQMEELREPIHTTR